jgi:hypothetical protein
MIQHELAIRIVFEINNRIFFKLYNDVLSWSFSNNINIIFSRILLEI